MNINHNNLSKEQEDELAQLATIAAAENNTEEATGLKSLRTFVQKEVGNAELLIICCKIILLLIFMETLFYGPRLFIFFPSLEWQKISLIISTLIALFTAIWVSFYYFFEQKFWQKILIFFLAAFFITDASYIMLGLAVGDAVTRIAGQQIEKNITGFKAIEYNSKGGNEYYIYSTDIPKNSWSKLDIHRKEYDSIVDPVKMHLLCRQSFFGLLVDNYTFTNQPAMAQ